MKALVLFGVLIGSLLCFAAPSSAQQGPVTAIDVALDPDATMMTHAAAANARLLKVYPAGFALDDEHKPHITTLQRYVRTADLDKVYDAVGKIAAGEKIAGWKLSASRYYFLPAGDIGLAGIVVEPTGDLRRLQQNIIDAVAPFAVKSGTAAAFVTTAKDPEVNQPTMDYVEAFVPEATGQKFNPHVTIGIATQEYLKAMLAEPFEAFTFSPAGVSVYQLGNFGTARKRLRTWDLKP
jgi:2'-5' RNA ligase